jgi:hypothetical protein
VYTDGLEKTRLKCFLSIPCKILFLWDFDKHANFHLSVFTSSYHGISILTLLFLCDVCDGNGGVDDSDDDDF